VQWIPGVPCEAAPAVTKTCHHQHGRALLGLRDRAASIDRQPGAGGSLRSIVKWRSKRHNGAMPSVQIKDVPEHTHAVLRQRAAAAHQSLQEYLRTKLIQEASAPTVEEVLDRAGGRAGGRVPIKRATEILREDRDRR
jgi:plasmid stability protein